MSELRIISGSAKGRSLKIPDSARPTPARIRKSLFDLLEHRYDWAETFLDLCAGAGGVGLEAASRGYQTTLVENNAAAIATLKKNAQTLKLKTEIVQSDALKFATNTQQVFAIVFYDPPYHQDIGTQTNILLQLPKLFMDSGLLIVQTPVQQQLLPQAGYNFERRVYGSNALQIYQKN